MPVRGATKRRDRGRATRRGRRGRGEALARGHRAGLRQVVGHGVFHCGRKSGGGGKRRVVPRARSRARGTTHDLALPAGDMSPSAAAAPRLVEKTLGEARRGFRPSSRRAMATGPSSGSTATPPPHLAGTRPAPDGGRLVSTGVAELDDVLGGGLPLGAILLLLDGTGTPPASGKREGSSCLGRSAWTVGGEPRPPSGAS